MRFNGSCNVFDVGEEIALTLLGPDETLSRYTDVLIDDELRVDPISASDGALTRDTLYGSSRKCYRLCDTGELRLCLGLKNSDGTYDAMRLT